ncbi:MAG: type II toxin-antitoxin system MqsA family antitoxin [Proteobacteria bacterium]|nr:type II toxin-antitoxin system MqsA family antitoxin [Pseudomonadota bacterium]
MASPSKNDTPKQSLKSDHSAISSSSPPTSPNPLCASCGQPGVRLRKVTRSFGRGSSLLVIEDIPLWTCSHCGESYFTAQTLHEIEHIKALRKSIAVDRPIPVAIFQAPCANITTLA